VIYCDSGSGELLTWDDVIARASAAHPNKTAAITHASTTALLVYGVSVVTETPAPDVEPWQTLEQGPIELAGGEWRTTWTVNTPPLADIVNAKFAELAAARWEYQSGGVNVGGISIASDQGTQISVTAALEKMKSDPAMVITWKTNAGDFVPLDRATLTAVGDALFQHVQNAFAQEAALMATVGSIADDETLTDSEKIAEIWAVQWADPIAE